MKTLFLAVVTLFVASNAFASKEALFLYNTLKEAGISETAIRAERGGNTVFWQDSVEQAKVPALSCVATKKTTNCTVDVDARDGGQIIFSADVSKKLMKALGTKDLQCKGGTCEILIDEVECRYVTDSSDFKGNIPSMEERTSCYLLTGRTL